MKIHFNFLKKKTAQPPSTQPPPAQVQTSQPAPAPASKPVLVPTQTKQRRLPKLAEKWTPPQEKQPSVTPSSEPTTYRPPDLAQIMLQHKLAEKRMLQQVKEAPRKKEAPPTAVMPTEPAGQEPAAAKPQASPLKQFLSQKKPATAAPPLQPVTQPVAKTLPEKGTQPAPETPPAKAVQPAKTVAKQETKDTHDAPKPNAHHAESEEAALARTRQRLRQKAAAKKRQERRTEQQRRRILSSLLIKSGFSMRPERLTKVVFYLTLIITAACSLLSITLAAASGKSATDILLFSFGLWTAVFAFIYLFIWMVIYVLLDIRIYRRTQELEEVLPDFLQLASANISAGMPIDRALWFAVRPNFGVLAKEIEEVAKATLAGEELKESLLRFTEKYDSVTLQRSISILLEGIEAGGEMAELLNKIAIDIQETKILRKEMSANVATYAIFITFASIIMAPLLFALATELLVIIVKITSTLNLGNTTSNFLTLNITSTPEMVTNFRWFCVVMLSITSLMSASIVSVIRKGKVKDGLRNLPIFLAVSLILYYIASLSLGSLLSNLI